MMEPEDNKFCSTRDQPLKSAECELGMIPPSQLNSLFKELFLKCSEEQNCASGFCSGCVVKSKKTEPL